MCLRSLTSGTYGNANGEGLQTANACALAIGAADAAGAAALAAAALVTDVAQTHQNHWSVGIIGMRFLHSALVQGGASDLAIQNLLEPDYPGFSWWFNHPDEPATTMNELPDMSAEGPGMNSRNHHMFASVGGWLYEDLAGIGQVRNYDPAYDPTDSTQVGFRHAVLYPRATTHPDVGFIQAEYESAAGRYAISWASPSAAGSSSTCAVDAPENSPYTFSCPAGGVFTGVTFASFGTPSGSCASFAKGSCDAANSTSIVEAACVGKSSCTVLVSTTVFGERVYPAALPFGAPAPAPPRLTSASPSPRHSLAPLQPVLRHGQGPRRVAQVLGRRGRLHRSDGSDERLRHGAHPLPGLHEPRVHRRVRGQLDRLRERNLRGRHTGRALGQARHDGPPCRAGDDRHRGLVGELRLLELVKACVGECKGGRLGARRMCCNCNC